jgi:hypothetical protein
MPLVFITLGCFPGPVTYLKPSAPGGQHRNSTCGGEVGPEDRLVLADSTGVMVGLETYSLEELSEVLRSQDERLTRGRPTEQTPTVRPTAGTGFSIILYVPEGRSLRFVSRSFVITDQRNATVQERVPTRVFSSSGRLLDGLVAGMVGTPHSPKVGPQIDVGETLVGAPGTRSSRGVQRWFDTRVARQFYVIVEFDNLNCRDCTLRMPPMQVDSTAVQFPEIRLRTVREWFWSTLNC